MVRIRELPLISVQGTELLPASFLRSNDTQLCYQVADREIQSVSFHTDGTVSCSCGDSACIHMLSALEKSKADGHMADFRPKIEKFLGSQMIRELNRILPGGEGIHLVSTLRVFPDGKVGLGLSVGQDHLIRIKNIGDFLTAHAFGIPLMLSDKFEYMPVSMRFSREDERLLSILTNHVPLRADTPEEWENELNYREQGERKKEHNRTDYIGRFLILSGALLYSVLHYFESREFIFSDGNDKSRQSLIRTEELPLIFRVATEGTDLCVTAEGFENLRLISEDGRFVIWNKKIVHIFMAQARICKLLYEKGFCFRYPAKESPEALNVLLPSLSTIGTVIPSAELSARLITESLHPVIYLDLERQNVIASVEFHYGDIIIDPFDSQSTEEVQEDETGRRKLLLRDGHQENLILNMLSEAGFVVAGKKIVLRKAKDILEFCARGIVNLEQSCTVFASKRFEKVRPRKLQAKAVFTMRGSHLIMQLMEMSGESVDTQLVLQGVVQHQDYVRLRSGEFLDIRDLTGLSPIAEQLLEARKLDEAIAEEDSPELHFQAYRSAYMVSMLQAAGILTEADEQVGKTVESITCTGNEGESYLPQELKERLTAYQTKGVNWLFSLYNARMGGILADEMGLGKTVQIIAALCAAKEKDGRALSIIVTPTSLTYHWLAEFKRFAGSMVVRVVNGPKAQRSKTIEEVLKSTEVDILLTSYPLLRRDIDLLKETEFRFAILDEAQSVKNAQSYGASAAKELKAETRLALTGTPMENHTGELWSIFDFILPGYLGTQAGFLHRYGGGEHSEELRSRIQPFLMRRLKTDVMKELPDKHEELLYAAMTEEQESIYRNLLKSLQGYVGETLSNGELPKSKIQILALLLKLRQVCCHPKLFLEDYEGSSGKLELLVHLVESSIANHHRILIFSQFVGMLQLIRKRLIREGIQTLYMDGSTEPGLRQQLCDRFNGGDGKVFLISLKAGGVGLNLIGADLVIHYDPWWNPAAEDQATDRVHRIGQTKDVNVIRLITQDTIEEKVMEMSQRKRSLFDKVIVAGEQDFSSLTEEDIRALFFDEKKAEKS